MASKELQIIVDMLRAAPMFDGSDFTALRVGMEQTTGSVPRPEGVTYEAASANGVPAEWAIPEGAVDGRCVIYFHGGGYVRGSLNTHRGLVSNIALASNSKVLAVDYRLAPENPHPAAVEDGVAAYRFVRECGIAPEHIGIAGDSAGGGLTVATLLALREAGDALPVAAVCLSPWLDLTMSSESMATKAEVDPMVQKSTLEPMAAAYVGQGDRKAPTASPLFADLSGLPDMLVHVGTAETLLDDSIRFVKNARAAGVDVSLDAYDDMIHVWHAFAAILPEGKEAIERIGSFFNRRLA